MRSGRESSRNRLSAVLCGESEGLGTLWSRVKKKVNLRKTLAIAAAPATAGGSLMLVPKYKQKIQAGLEKAGPASILFPQFLNKKIAVDRLRAGAPIAAGAAGGMALFGGPNALKPLTDTFGSKSAAEQALKNVESLPGQASASATAPGGGPMSAGGDKQNLILGGIALLGVLFLLKQR